MNILRQATGKDGHKYRLIDELPMWGGYYSIEKAKTYVQKDITHFTAWEMVFGPTKDMQKAEDEFEKLTAA